VPDKSTWSLPVPRLLALLAALACGGPTVAPPEQPLVLCVVPLNVVVSGSTAPEYRWSPGCGATYLEVTTLDRQGVMWIVQGDPARVGPGVRYGVAAEGFASTYGPSPLTRGERYVVRVGIMIDENSFAIFGEREFTY
jgi:hypothetical protein